MRLLHTADLHLGRQFHGMSLEDDHAAILAQILQALIEHQPDVFIIAGDVFDRASPPTGAVRQFNEFIKRVAHETHAAVVIIAGNHDSSDRIESMSIMTDQGRALIRGPLSNEEQPLILQDDAGPVAISALPFGYEFAARECFQNADIATPEHVIRAQIAAARRHVPRDARWVVVAHAFVSGASVSESERPLVRVGGIETVPSDAFAGAHYVALGHLHRPQEAGAPHIRYSGAPLAFGFDEAGGVKSMNLVDLAANGEVSVRTIPFAPLRHVQVLKGRLGDLVKLAPSDAITKIVLTDEGALIDPMKRIREVFANTCLLTYARNERVPEMKSAPSAQSALSDPLTVIQDFLASVRGSGLSDPEERLVASTLAGFHESEARA